MRVAIVCPYSVSRPGGVQGQVAGLARSLRVSGHQVTVLSPDDEHPIGERQDAPRGDPGAPAPSVVVGRSTPLRANGSVAPVSVSPLSAWRARSYVDRHRFDVVHLHEPLAPVIGYGFLLRSGLPLVGTFHRSGDSAWYRALRPVARWAGGRIAARVAVSEAAAETVRRSMDRSCEVLFNGVEVSRFAAASPVPTDRPTVIFLGRHENRKGLGVLLQAFDQVTDRAVLWVAGDGPLTAALRQRHPESERLRWLGVLDEEELAARLAGAHVLCAPSLYGESFGMVLVEAMAAGSAVVASDIPGYRAAAAGYASLVPPDDVAALARALRRAVADAAARTGTVSAAALEAARRHAAGWSMDRLAERYVDLYEEVLGRPGEHVSFGG